MDARPQESGLYHQFSRCYDFFFGPAFKHQLHSTVRSLELPAGTRILEVGVGTGLSLAAYPHDVELVGIDLAEEMLVKARERVTEQGWHHVTLRQMDATRLEFPDAQFDYVMAFHMITVVPDPRGVMAEMLRVLRPGGRLVIVNHFRSPRRWLARCIDLLDPLTRRLGWTTRLSLDDVLRNWPLHVEKRYKTSPRSLYTVVVARKQGSE